MHISSPRNVMASGSGGGRQTSKMMYDFRSLASVTDWVESSDTVREPGMSKGAFVLQVSVVLNGEVSRCARHSLYLTYILSNASTYLYI